MEWASFSSACCVCVGVFVSVFAVAKENKLGVVFAVAREERLN